MNKIINKWHSILDMPKKDFEWHREDIIEKIEKMARKYNLNPEQFKLEANKLMKRWMFLK